MAEDANNVSANEIKQPEDNKDGSKELDPVGAQAKEAVSPKESDLPPNIPDAGDVQAPEPKVLEQPDEVGFDPPEASGAVQGNIEVANKIEDCESQEDKKEVDDLLEDQKNTEEDEDLSDLSDAQDDIVEPEVEEVIEAKEEEEIVASRDDDLPVLKVDAEPMVIEPIAFTPPKEPIERPRVKRRRSIAESPSIIQELDQFTRVDLSVDADDEIGLVSLDDKIETPTHICFTANDYQVKIPRDAKSMIGLLDTALGADVNLETLECSQASPWALDIIKTYVDWRLEKKAMNPIQIQVSAPVRDLLISDKFEVQLLNKIQAIEQIFELARSAEYLQIDVLLDTIYKYIVISLSDGTEQQIGDFLLTGKWHKPWYVNIEEAKTPDVDPMELGLDDDDDLDDHKIMLVPGDDEARKESSKKCKYDGAIGRSIGKIDSETLHAPFAKLPSHCWRKIAETSCVNRNYCITWKQAALSNLIVNIGSDATMIRITQCDADSLNSVCRYLRHHNGLEPAEIAKPIRSVKMEKIVEDAWDATFINSFDKRDIFKLTLAANYMDIKSLLHLTCAKVATMIKGKSPEEIKQILGEEE